MSDGSGDAYAGCDGLRVDLGDDTILRLTIDRVEKRNALDDGMVAAMIAAVDSAGRDEAVRAILICGAGEHFCGGFDIVARNAARSDRKPRVGSIQRRLPSQAHRLIPLLVSVQVPVVCSVQGWAAGIGLHLAVAADFTVAAEDARFWEPFSERGFTPDSGGTWLLPRRVGEVRARELLLLGRRLSGQEAAEWGLIHRAVAGAEVHDRRRGAGPAAGPWADRGFGAVQMADGGGRLVVPGRSPARRSLCHGAVVSQRGFPRRPGRLLGEAQS